ncbi:MAG: DUF4350 domain-containing protein [Bacillota bacterium]
MKNKLIVVLVILAVVLGVLFLWQSGTYYPSYSVYNRSENGLSIFYETLQELDYSVERTLKPASEVPRGTVQIIAGLREEDIPLEWVRSGGTVICLTPGGDNYVSVYLDEEVEERVEPESRGEYNIYKIGEGRVISGSSGLITNIRLIEDTEEAYNLLEMVSEHETEGIYFNERHFFSGETGETFWDIVPRPLKYVFYQLLLVLAAYLFYRGKRLGKPRPLVEEEERLYNEYLFAAADLYREAGSTDLMVENYYRSFLDEIGYGHENWLQYWRRKKLPGYDTAERVYSFMESVTGQPDPGKSMRIVKMIDKLRQFNEGRKG